ncbi:MAG: cupin domain-containing protein [Anaerolineae bacterium]|nr:cupin domain-containing protein [Anaerolineae bacterium]
MSSKRKTADSQLTPTCVVIHTGKAYTGKQGLNYFAGISAESAGARGLCMHLLTIPPGGRAKAHLHESHETAIYVLSGEAETWYGEGLRQHLTVRAGDFLYIPAGMPHQPVNLSQTKPCTAVIARTDPNEQESVVLLPQLDKG